MEIDPNTKKLVERLVEIDRQLAEKNKELRRLHREMGYPRYRRFWSALGQFLHYFAEVERQLVETLAACCGLKPDVANILFAGLRVDAASTSLRAVCNVRKMSNTKRRELLSALDQLGHITRARNDILHFGTDRIDPKRLIVSNRLRAKSKRHIREFEISPAALDAMHSDAITILTILHVHSLPRAEQRTYHPEPNPPAWRYTPPVTIARDDETVEAMLRRRRRLEPVPIGRSAWPTTLSRAR